MPDLDRLPRETSIFLDLTRVLAALAVFVLHFSYHRFSGGLFWQLGWFGGRAVDVFFVLSGFLIAYSVRSGRTSWRRYVVARLARVYSVALPALVLTLLCNQACALLGEPGRIPPASLGIPPIVLLLSNALFLGDVWNIHWIFGSNEPYWSLMFECWYYLGFGLALYLPPRLRLIGVLIAGCACGPRILALAPLWLLGAALVPVVLRDRVTPGQGVALILASLILLAWLPISGLAGFSALDPAPMSWARLLQPQQNLVTALAFGGLIVGVNAARVLLSPMLLALAKPVTLLAGASFAFYLFHYPLLELSVAVSPWPVGSWAQRGFSIVGVFAAIWLLSRITEQRKDAWVLLFQPLLGPPLQHGQRLRP